MTPRNLFDLILLAALWGGSFLFMRYAAPSFGAVALIWLRVAIAAACLLPLLWWRGQSGLLRQNMGAMLVVGLLNSAVPFVLIAWAVLSITSGLASILNAVTPIFTALIGALWLNERLSKSQMLGLLIGFVGVLLLAADKADFKAGGSGWAIVALLGATLCYGIVTHYTRHKLAGVPSLVTATGAQLAAAIVLLPLAYAFWPAVMPDVKAWLAVIGLGVGCTALAFALFFRLLAQVGASRAVTVTFLIPVFGVLWGSLFLGETVSASMLVGGAVIVLGTALATGVVRLPAVLA
ncbi:DMT family transporter [Thiothrix subterranea]|uniref:DMT family transporter n=1 Tax=Thiothrix subterranea TaxID=2735563 RepID=A0AA51MRD9_9GAMM|nr:DMT family transporter [Thiothrix subterranea]MDQ5770621.1 DMT family transporter [Thiothrix subterranea]WML86896.1 DMT family transporter [Thiothrix subterranea]